WVPALNKALVVGGQQVLANGANADVLPCERFDPVTSSFSAGPSLATGRMAHTLTGLNDGTFLSAGGWNSTQNKTTNTAERFTPNATNTLGGAWQSAGSMRDSRLDHGAALLPSGKALIAGGEKNEGTGIFLKGAELYAP